MAKNTTRDLTVGSPMKLILSFMLPLVFGLLFQQVYSMVDDDDELAAVAGVFENMLDDIDLV